MHLAESLSKKVAWAESAEAAAICYVFRVFSILALFLTSERFTAHNHEFAFGHAWTSLEKAYCALCAVALELHHEKDVDGVELHDGNVRYNLQGECLLSKHIICRNIR